MILNSRVITGFGLALAAAAEAGVQAPGRPQPAPGGVSVRPAITSLSVSPPNLVLQWVGLGGPFQVEGRGGLATGEWQAIGRPTTNFTLTVPASPGLGSFRIKALRVPDYLGASVCMRCHGQLHATWSQTAHAQAFEDLKPLNQDTNPLCLVCHTVGYGTPSGFQDALTTTHLAGVQCENCHGPGGEHAASPFEVKTPVVRLDSEMCGGCHSQFHHPTYDEWKVSGHAMAGPAAQSSSLAADQCLQCHAQDYRFAQEQGVRLPTAASAKFSVECTTCHEPHGGTTQDILLRQPVAGLCNECHAQADAPLGQRPHHPQLEMLQGIGTFAEDGSSVTNVSTHTRLLATNSCATCHVAQHAVAQPNYASPVMTTHNFDPFAASLGLAPADQYRACGGCHNLKTLDSFRRGIQADVTLRLTALAGYFTSASSTYVDPARLNSADQRRLAVAKSNYQFVDADGSRGVHNWLNTEAALEVAEGIMARLTQP